MDVDAHGETRPGEGEVLESSRGRGERLKGTILSRFRSISHVHNSTRPPAYSVYHSSFFSLLGYPSTNPERPLSSNPIFSFYIFTTRVLRVTTTGTRYMGSPCEPGWVVGPCIHNRQLLLLPNTDNPDQISRHFSPQKSDIHPRTDPQRLSSLVQDKMFSFF